MSSARGIDPSQPYASARSPVIGRNAVATSQPLAVQAGIRVLRAGGNAVDAAIATAITLAVVEPNNNSFGSDARLHELPPNGQGLGALMAAGVLARLESDRFPLDSADAVHLQIEASRIGIRHAFSHVADPDHLPWDPAELLAPEYLDALAAGISLQRADPRPLQTPTSPDTVYLSCADADGMAVSFIQSNYRGFGAGVLVPGTGIALHNRGEGFSLEPGHPNQVGPGKRPYHTIIPGFATRSDDALLAFGVMGGHMQHQGHLQMLERIVLRGQNPQAACDAPRWHIREDGRVALESGFDPAVAAELARRGHEVKREPAEHMFGGAQIIQRLADGAWCAGSDHRKEGHAAAF